MKNRRLWVSIVAGFLAVVMLLSLIVSIIPAHADEVSELEEKIEEMSSRLDQKDAEIEELKQQQNDNFDEIINVVNQKVNIEQQINLILDQIKIINDQINVYNRLIADTQDKLDKETEKFHQLNDKYKERIRTMEEEGSLSYWSVLFKASSFSDFLDRLNMVQEIAEADTRRIRELNDAAIAMEASKEALDGQKVDAEGRKEQLKESEATLAEKRQEAQELIDILLERHEEYEALLQEASAEKEALEAEIEQAKADLIVAEAEKAQRAYEAMMASIAAEESRRKEEEEQRRQEAIENGEVPPEEVESSEPYVPPVSDGWGSPIAYYTMVTSPYGWRVHPITGEQQSFHSGIDLAADYGTHIYAARNGIVTTSGYHWSFGNYVVINHGDGYSTLYAHMQERACSEGDRVYQGELIGYVGSTGESTGPHLHYTVYYNGETVNPATYL